MRDARFLFVLGQIVTLVGCSSSHSSIEGCTSHTDESNVTVSLTDLEPDAATYTATRDAGAALAVGENLDSDTCTANCPPTRGDLIQCSVKAIDGFNVTLHCIEQSICEGRRPARLAAARSRHTSLAGAHFAAIARLEAASVDAFRILRDELAAHGAPRRLVRACGRAARDEIRHARVTTALARRFGATPERAVVRREPTRALEEIARENAVEGCARETFGALVGLWQARNARDPNVRAAMKRIARDEARHAALSWSIDAWARARLDRAARKRVQNAHEAALAELAAGLTDAEPELASAAGLPSAAAARALLDAMSRSLAA